MKISMVAAMAKARIIGKDNAMPWHLPADFTWFKKVTMGKPVVMGRKTFESIGRPLPGRHNIVISRNADYQAEGVTVVADINAAKQAAGDVDELMVIGGGSIYAACLEEADRLYLTFIDLDVEGDTQFPDWGENWQEVHCESYTADEKNAHDMRFVILER
ncbi:type 3 dihydrofolate reductase [Photobacterium sp. DNB23_23_1]|uniref:Dihydrofolate reductase n=1 Tax=Photobacterium pectinilyticum TaxID=2906793 RepID=A0ABT1N8H7_9GAMM|nr:type 3 dihydrofolate reductase [Photobacterium sp. ZSDE20]MCQ1061065.1 type 3 dihydrofolate reductase [Photobacterium sp. ZSDE20]MDD1829183.1 type 3 dihydrofolate reductase [Photobacterium sp. ZSDE20]